MHVILELYISICVCVCLNSSARILSDISVILTHMFSFYALQRKLHSLLSRYIYTHVCMYCLVLLSKACFVYLRNDSCHCISYLVTFVVVALLTSSCLFEQTTVGFVCATVFSGRMMVVWVLFEHPQFFRFFFFFSLRLSI